MAGKEEDGPDYEVEKEKYMEMTLVLPDETVKNNYRIKVEHTTVGEEKQRLYQNSEIRYPPLQNLRLVLRNSNGPIVMVDNQQMSDYSEDFPISEIHMEQI